MDFHVLPDTHWSVLFIFLKQHTLYVCFTDQINEYFEKNRLNLSSVLIIFILLPKYFYSPSSHKNRIVDSRKTSLTCVPDIISMQSGLKKVSLEIFLQGIAARHNASFIISSCLYCVFERILCISSNPDPLTQSTLTLA